VESCPRCLKALDLCVCELVRPLETRTHVLILQHPQEPDKDLGSARLAHLALPNSTLRVGLSWPNLKAALGREAQPSRWAVLHLGSGLKTRPKEQSGLVLVSRRGEPLPDSTKLAETLEGIVLLDGTWSQAKTLWWRNAWLLKLRRAVLLPSRKSLYGELRREPRRECLSTIESVAEALQALGEGEPVGTELRSLFSELLKRKRARRDRRSS
jgi:DTW domain-containing protein